MINSITRHCLHLQLPPCPTPAPKGTGARQGWVLKPQSRSGNIEDRPWGIQGASWIWRSGCEVRRSAETSQDKFKHFDHWTMNTFNTFYPSFGLRKILGLRKIFGLLVQRGGVVCWLWKVRANQKLPRDVYLKVNTSRLEPTSWIQGLLYPEMEQDNAEQVNLLRVIQTN